MFEERVVLGIGLATVLLGSFGLYKTVNIILTGMRAADPYLLAGGLGLGLLFGSALIGLILLGFILTVMALDVIV